MNLRPWQIWCAGLLCLALVTAALTWLSYRAVAADRAERNAQLQANQEENIRLALWRVDTAMAALISDENTRPTHNYSAMVMVPNADNSASETILISPLLSPQPPEVRCYFQINSQGKISSPQVVEKNWQYQCFNDNFDPALLEVPQKNLGQCRELLKNPQTLTKHLPPVEDLANNLEMQQVQMENSPKKYKLLIPAGNQASNFPLNSTPNRDNARLRSQPTDEKVNQSSTALNSAAVQRLMCDVTSQQTIPPQPLPQESANGTIVVQAGNGNVAAGSVQLQQNSSQSAGRLTLSSPTVSQGSLTLNNSALYQNYSQLPQLPATLMPLQLDVQQTENKKAATRTKQKEELNANDKNEPQYFYREPVPILQSSPDNLSFGLDKIVSQITEWFQIAPLQYPEKFEPTYNFDSFVLDNSVLTTPSVASVSTPNQKSDSVAEQNNKANAPPTNDETAARFYGNSNPQTVTVRSRGANFLQSRGDNAVKGKNDFDQSENSEQEQKVKGQTEYQARASLLAKNAYNLSRQETLALDAVGNMPSNNKITSNISQNEIRVSRMQPVWVGSELFLARRVMEKDKELIQGCWLNWQEQKASLLDSIKDLLPNATLLPVDELPSSESVSSNSNFQHLLATLPARLDPGQLIATEAVQNTWTPLQWSLIVAWSSFVLAALAVGLVGQGTISLSERRATFVSAVTHELRTPLTTFRMYAEMLAEDMVPDEEARRKYCQTLRGEADRLSHLVENVLAYARLERGDTRRRQVPVSLAELLRVATERLDLRAQNADFELNLNVPEELMSLRLVTDPSAVEQILFNLVDNACKYAAEAKDRAIDINANVARNILEIRVHDHGPGIPAGERGRLFQPFRKSAAQAATSAPGVGLGLALSRRLARDLGGDLQYIVSSQPGACFKLTLPVAEIQSEVQSQTRPNLAHEA